MAGIRLTTVLSQSLKTKKKILQFDPHLVILQAEGECPSGATDDQFQISSSIFPRLTLTRFSPFPYSVILFSIETNAE